jgi:phthiodiolone/phenolphthiodiolone dimycocerosates ketoreductase
MRDVKYGENPPQFPPVSAHRPAVEAFEAAGHDFICYWDQHVLTIPRSIWTPDICPAAELYHVDSWFEPWPQMTEAALATSRIGIGLTVSDALRRPPSILAQLASTLDHYSEGRFFLGLGAGEDKQATPYGIQRNKIFGRLEETLTLVKKFWSTFDPVSYDGEFYKVKQASVGAPPFTPGGPRTIIGGGPGRAMRIAAQQADGWMSYAPNGVTEPEEYASQVEEYNKLVTEAGRNPDDMARLVAFCVILADTEEEVDDIARNPVIQWDTAALIPSTDVWSRYGFTNPLPQDWSYARDLRPLEWEREDALKICSQVPVEMVHRMRLCGTPEQVAAKIQPYIEAGCNHVILADYAGVATTANFFGGISERHNRLFNKLRELNGQPLINA